MSEAVEKQQATGVQARAQSAAQTSSAESERTQAPAMVPAADIFEHAEGVTLVLDMPGVSRERLQIQTDQDSLTVEGSVEITMPSATESLYADVRSTQYGRSFSLSGEQLDIDAIKATLKQGVLQIDIPKRAEKRPRKIEVQVA